MFPLQRSGELFFGVGSKSSTNSHHQLHRIPQDLISSDLHDHYDVESSGALDASNIGQRRRKASVVAASSKSESVGVEDESTRKKKHREIEKQRRQEMASLYAGLRSLLPLEYIKGKRSISDHMNEAVNYIKHLHVKLSELSDHRDKLKRLSKSVPSNSSRADSTDCSQNCVIEVVHLSDGDDVEIIIIRGLKKKEENSPLSIVLELLSQRGLNVVNCFYTKVNDRTLNRFHCKATDANSMDLEELRQILEAAIN
ncbi:hypothetical protein CDL15_Pgr022897 [Punica granatum]|uniref:BHLH domain-containing protein n=1 Tax=Punica granatum TaxID=22663 RepID=A0A218X2Q8_PUNGR|nr:hypothetical protein CDL15_Pgr022897 [Punica granatum]